jgi:hypothetical protein
MSSETADTLTDIASDLSGVAATIEPDVTDPTSSVLSPDAVIAPPPGSSGTAPKTWAKFLSKRLAHLYVDAIEAMGDRMKPRRKMNEPEDEDVDAFGESLAEVLTVWFPDSELSPGKKCLISATTIGVSMFVGSTVIETPRTPSSNVHAAPTNGVHKSEPTPEPPNPSADAVGSSILATVRKVY